MAQIGQFTRTQTGYSGRVRTLSLDLAVVLLPVDSTDVENAPDYRIRVSDEDGVEIGAGWLQTGDRAGAYISIVLDDPTFTQPIRARLFQSDESGRDWGLHWTRQKKRDDQDKPAE
ncbi:MAG: hypothetical protein BGO82_05375 [Devosia sp. 67-54]|uniref:DUF736 domain-containing protein n=1 Tax=unclassified Devosia TaxID=196773 RepID=UPI00086F8BC5|nr:MULTISPECIES: DUF736 domain-containing protein [unclassified Devosia]MBN9306954.1 DUF736 domain-containing protein [Devosia sp.]ODU58598.1 MAG: hypothetical protein ABS99_04240 [Acetobacteraceae bacterium SCN 69-10]OJX16954.1 MAG: hypothetical protein BGO82_05375 [Devosia sp. 67-54]